MFDSMLMVLFVMSYAALVTAVAWLLWRDHEARGLMDQMAAHMKAVLETNGRVMSLLNTAARRRPTKTGK
jgi:hypothetical protein